MFRRLLDGLARKNPFYLLSALCMITGCLVLSQALHLKPGQLDGLLVLLATLNVYEGILIALAIFLVRHEIVRDGRMLLILETLFLSDATFLGLEAAAAHPVYGAVVALTLFLLALLKGAVLRRALGIPSAGVLSLAGLQVAVVLGLPLTLAALGRAAPLPPLAVHCAWWVAGLLLALRSLLLRPSDISPVGPIPAHQHVEPAFRRALEFVPLASLLIHLVATGWIYGVSFHIANFAPVLIGLAVAADRLEPGRRTIVRYALPAAAILLSITFPDDLLFTAPVAGGVVLSPLRLVLGLVSLVYLRGGLAERRAGFAWAAAASPLLACLGHRVGAMVASVAAALRTLGGMAPRTAVGWGTTAVASSFALLGLGAALSLSRFGRFAGGGRDPRGGR